mmetsp:Transcript_201/g.602  ORF Transcript_201/g.602 Transcript_201/m.602 type:complete len:201 (+) Transcript_201:679-1281(+)
MGCFPAKWLDNHSSRGRPGTCAPPGSSGSSKGRCPNPPPTATVQPGGFQTARRGGRCATTDGMAWSSLPASAAAAQGPSPAAAPSSASALRSMAARAAQRRASAPGRCSAAVKASTSATAVIGLSPASGSMAGPGRAASPAPWGGAAPSRPRLAETWPKFAGSCSERPGSRLPLAAGPVGDATSLSAPKRASVRVPLAHS